MGLLKNDTGRNISVANVNGYTVEKVLRAKAYLREIGMNRRTFPMERLVEMYNDIKNTHESAKGCKPCQANKFYNGIKNYVTYGELTLANNGIAIDDKEAPQAAETTEVDELPTDGEITEQKPKKQAKKRKNNEEGGD